MRTLLVGALFALSACATAMPAAPAARSFDAGPIWHQQDAELKCPIVARVAGGQWNGHWRTTRWNEMSECDITGSNAIALAEARDVEVGPIWNQQDAELKCPVAAAAAQARWTGHWRTTRENEMSVCALTPRA